MTEQQSRKSNTEEVKCISEPITKNDVETIVNNAFKNDAKLVNYEIGYFGEDKVGFMGAYRRLIINVQQKDKKKETRSFFVKSIPYEVEEQATVVQENNVFFKETLFYSKIMPELVMSVKDKSWLPQCYLIKDDVLVFEDLRAKNFALKDKHLDIPALKAALSALAKLHVSTILAEKRLGKTLAELYPESFEEWLYVREGKFGRWFRTGVDVLVAIAKYLRLEHSRVRRVCDRAFEAILPSKTRRNVVCHGDVKSYNFMFADNGEPIPQCVMIDYQCTRYYPATTDVAQLLYLNTVRPVRERHEQELLRHYYEVACQMLRENGGEASLMPSFEDMQKEYEETRLFGLVSTALSSPHNMMDGKICEELTRDSDGYAELLFGDHADIVLNVMREDAVYNNIMVNIVEEIVERSEQLLEV